MIINGTPEDFELRSSDDEFAAVQLSNFCANDCLYCKYSRENWTIDRKRKSKEEVMKAFDKTNAQQLPVVDNQNILIGYVSRSHVYSLYRKMVADLSND